MIIIDAAYSETELRHEKLHTNFYVKPIGSDEYIKVEVGDRYKFLSYDKECNKTYICELQLTNPENEDGILYKVEVESPVEEDN